MARPQLPGASAPSASMAPSAALARATPAVPAVQTLARPMTSTVGALVARPVEVRRSDRPLDPRLFMVADPTSARAEAFRLLRDNLVARGLARVLAVTSAAAREGKTTCAVNLALALAERGGPPILLVDGNFFAPSLAEIFAIDANTPATPASSFPELAAFKIVEISPCLHVAALLLPRPTPPSAMSVICRFEAIVDRLWRIGYERVIIDGPALDGSPTVGPVLRAADGVLLSVRARHTKTGAVRRALNGIVEGKALGAVIMELD